ncbi:transcriptional regulator, TetR family [Nocardioides sp. YR527]|uniref:TetR/AcrR family transcriptional regulator n=1 Tax=Nocardioides sp. YR527 TaxID=1881028 RepID=UPI0008801709|nr:TetR/AcrR family transcriptional regulator [Nocardioides sp. YR527]SDK34174.1 transcriptional regulator, TetR family [Nocardioides sp. YR527]
MSIRRTHPGRPRLVPSSTAAPPREQVLHAAAQLFVTKGFAATSTREIADRVGIRQASLYYHFTSKDEILAELLERSVRPTVDRIDQIEQLTASTSPEAALYLLALVDIHTLAEAPDNIGMLATHPDVTSSDAFDAFRSVRAELAEAYGRMATRAATPGVAAAAEQGHLGEMLMHLVEVTTRLRSSGVPIDDATAGLIASTCLRACGIPDSRIAAAASAATPLVGDRHSRTASP